VRFSLLEILDGIGLPLHSSCTPPQATVTPTLFAVVKYGQIPVENQGWNRFSHEQIVDRHCPAGDGGFSFGELATAVNLRVVRVSRSIDPHHFGP
jgi:hypothetical protein